MDTSSEPSETVHPDPGAIGDETIAVGAAAGTAGEAVRVVPEPGAPSDNTTLTAVLTTLDEDGFAGQFVVREGAEVECLTCGQASPAVDFVPRRSRRLEGASDPDDLVHVIATTCPACNVGGTLVLGYGVNASPDDGDVSQAMHLRGVDAQLPDDASAN